jgi:hypothetical protein
MEEKCQRVKNILYLYIRNPNLKNIYYEQRKINQEKGRKKEANQISEGKKGSQKGKKERAIIIGMAKKRGTYRVPLFLVLYFIK